MIGSTVWRTWQLISDWDHKHIVVRKFNCLLYFFRLQIGIVGRTGSGKSSLFLVLFRMVGIESGSRVLLDGIYLASVPLQILRYCLLNMSSSVRPYFTWRLTL